MLKETLLQGQKIADAALERLLPAATQYPSSIHQAMRHSVFAGGKRLRPVLCMEVGTDDQRRNSRKALTNSARQSRCFTPTRSCMTICPRSIMTTCAVAAPPATRLSAKPPRSSPAMLCRPRPTKSWRGCKCPAEARVRIIEELAHGTGTIDGMIGGQVVDLESEHVKPDLPTLEYIHRAKTGALIVSSLLTGCYYVDAKPAEVQRVREFGRAAGLAFQIADDILDVTQTSEQLGKTAGKDLAAEKVTYPALFGLPKAEEMAAQLIRTACSALDSFGERANTLKEIAHYLVERKK